MTDGLSDPDAETQGASREGVEDVHKASVVGRQPPVSLPPLEVRASRVQTCRPGHFHLSINRSHPRNSEVIRKGSSENLPVILPILFVVWLPANPATWAPRL